MLRQQDGRKWKVAIEIKRENNATIIKCVTAVAKGYMAAAAAKEGLLCGAIIGVNYLV